MPPPILPWQFGPTGMVKGQPQEPAYSGPPGAWYDITHAGEEAAGTAQNIQANPLKEFVHWAFTPSATSPIPPGRVATVWLIIIVLGIIGVSGLLRR